MGSMGVHSNALSDTIIAQHLSHFGEGQWYLSEADMSAATAEGSATPFFS